MLKNYFYHFIALLFFLNANASFAQGTIVANDDSYTINGINGGSVNGVRINDVINGSPGSQVNCNQTTLTQISTTNAGITLNTFCGQVIVQAGTPAGVYTLVYQLCLAGNPAICDTAAVTVTVCDTPAPVIDSTSLIGCTSTTSTVQISGLPATGTWTLKYQTWNSTMQVTGTGTSTTLELSPGGYQISVLSAEGCQSPQAALYIDYAPDLEGELLTSYEDTNNDGIVSIGDTVIFTLSVTNPLDCDIINIDINDTSLNFTGGPIAILAPGQTDNSTITAVYTITQEDINNGYVGTWAGVLGEYGNGQQTYTKAWGDLDLDLEDGIQLVAFIDSNGNGIKDNGEAYFNQGQFTYQLNGGSQVNVATYNGQHTMYETDITNSYNFGFELGQASCADQYVVQVSGYNNVTVPLLSGITTYFFPITIVPCTDLQAYVFGPPVGVGSDFYSTVIVRNNGNQTIASGSVEFFHDPAVSMVGFIDTAATITSTGFLYNFTDLEPGEVIYLYPIMHAPPIPQLNLGDILTSAVVATIPTDDTNPDNNSGTCSHVVVGAYDPNDKAENHGPQIAFDDFGADEYLLYTIRFENVGTANASVVRIEDMLEAGLDESSLRMVASSHNYVMERTGNSVVWTFDNIQLPPSDGEADSMVGKGYVVFAIQPTEGYQIGTIIENNASIYFDTNPAIETNVVTTEFVQALGNKHFTAGKIIAYPNPVKDVLTIKNNNKINAVTVYNTLGQQVLTQAVNSYEYQLNLQQVNQGIYFITVTTGHAEETIKIVKE